MAVATIGTRRANRDSVALKAQRHGGAKTETERGVNSEWGSQPLETPETLETVERLQGLLDRYRRRKFRGDEWADHLHEGIPTGLQALDEALPGGGLPRGAVTEVLSGGSGIGAWTLGLRAAMNAAGVTYPGSSDAATHYDPRVVGQIPGDDQPPHENQKPSTKTVVVVDCDGDFYPPSAVAMGLPIDHLLIVRPRNATDAFWAAHQALCCKAVAAVIATRLHLDHVRSRRLQLAAEYSGGIGLILNSVVPRRTDRSLNPTDIGTVWTHTFAAVRLLIEPVETDRAPNAVKSAINCAPWHSGRRRCRITLLKVRNQARSGRKQPGPIEPFIAELNDETFDVSLHPGPVDQPTRRRLIA